jgi:hypothetical protein
MLADACSFIHYSLRLIIINIYVAFLIDPSTPLTDPSRDSQESSINWRQWNISPKEHTTIFNRTGQCLVNPRFGYMIPPSHIIQPFTQPTGTCLVSYPIAVITSELCKLFNRIDDFITGNQLGWVQMRDSSKNLLFLHSWVVIVVSCKDLSGMVPLGLIN